MTANFGGTDIYNPLSDVITKTNENDKETRIFLLTDGDVSNRD